MHTSHNQALSRGATPRESTGLFNARERNLDLSAERALAKSLASLPVCCVCHKRIPANIGYAIIPAAASHLLPPPTANRQQPTVICDTCLDQPLPPDPPAAANGVPDPVRDFHRETRRIQQTWKQIDVATFEAAGYIDEDDEQREASLLEQEFFMDQRYLEGQQVAEILEDYVGDMSIQEAA